ncbi:MAG: hypothetical protein R6U43_08125 [Candidatus Krumholzibacteriales bacterium]
MKCCFRKIIDLSFLLLFVLLISAGCSDDDTIAPVPPPEFQILKILSNPLSPEPGSVDTLAARVVGSSSGERISYRWSVEEGALMENDEGVVRWQVPQVKGEYTVRLEIEVGGDTRRDSTIVSVRDQDVIDTGRLHSIFPQMVNGELFFISPFYSRFITEEEKYSFADFQYYGADLYRYEDSTVSVKITEGLYDDVEIFHREEGAGYFGITEDGQRAIVSVFNNYNTNYAMTHMNIGRYDLHGGTDIKITYDMDGQSDVNRYNQYRHPSFNSDGSSVVMEYVQAGEQGDGSEDLVNIAYWEEGDGFMPEILVESVDTVVVKEFSFPVYFQNILPQLTPDENSIIYFSNRISVVDTLPNYYEPYAIPIIGGEPDTSQTEFFDIVRDTRIRIGANTIIQWSPNGDMAAFSAAVSNMPTLCYLNYNSVDRSLSIDVTGLTRVHEFVWAPDGSMGAIINDDGVYLVTPGGGIITEVLNKERDTDDMYGVNWSRNGDKLAFRVVRKGKVWFESWNAIMEYSLSDDRLVYVSEAYRWEKRDEPADIDYRWKRVHYDEMGEIYAPIFTSADPNTLVSVSRIVHLY